MRGKDYIRVYAVREGWSISGCMMGCKEGVWVYNGGINGLDKDV